MDHPFFPWVCVCVCVYSRLDYSSEARLHGETSMIGVKDVIMKNE